MAKRNGRQKLIGVKWIDTTHHSGWQDDLKKVVPTEILSVGFLVDEDKDQVRIAQNLSEDGVWGDVEVIPRVLVRQVRKLAIVVT